MTTTPTPAKATPTPAKRAPSKKRPPPAAPNWKSKGSAAELGETEQIAHGIITDRPDLMPSVERIMNASLDADDRQRALELFRHALTTPGDQHRDPRVAIERCTPKAP